MKPQLCVCVCVRAPALAVCGDSIFDCSEALGEGAGLFCALSQLITAGPFNTEINISVKMFTQTSYWLV